MIEFLCNYAIVRFLPYKDIGEFINVGVVVHCPETGLFDFRLAERRNRRVRLFFPEMEAGIYRAALDVLRRELNRLRNTDGLFAAHPRTDIEISEGINQFRALLRRREALLHFAAPGTVLANPQSATAELFERYVERRFARDPAYQESVMRSTLGRWMHDWGLRDAYKRNVKVGDEMFHLTLPFVQVVDNRVTKAIKPLDLDRAEPTLVFEHGDLWVGRVRRLLERHALPDRMIFAVRSPNEGAAAEAAHTVMNDLAGVHAECVPFEKDGQLRQAVEV